MPKRTQLRKMKGRNTKLSRKRKSQKLNKMKGGTKKRKTSASKKRKSLKMRGGATNPTPEELKARKQKLFQFRLLETSFEQLL